MTNIMNVEGEDKKSILDLENHLQKKSREYPKNAVYTNNANDLKVEDKGEETSELHSVDNILQTNKTHVHEAVYRRNEILSATAKVKPLLDFYDVCVIGAGLTGAVISEQYANKLNKTVLVVEKRNHIGGRCYDFVDEETNIRVNKYGVHFFHTKSNRVWNYLQRFSNWTKQGPHTPVQINTDANYSSDDLGIQVEKEIKKMEEKDHKIALTQMRIRLHDLIDKPKEIRKKKPSRTESKPISERIKSISDPHRAFPSNGYTAIFEKIFDNHQIDVRLNTDYFEIRNKLNCKIKYYTGPIDAYFNRLGWEKLEYLSLNFERKVIHDIDYFQPKPVVFNLSPEKNFTMIVEYKHLLNQSSPHTIISNERFKSIGEPYKPVTNEKNMLLYERYKEMADREKNTVFVGALAEFRDLDMDETILNALNCFEKVSNGMEKWHENQTESKK